MKILTRIRNMNTGYKNVFILIMTLLPFIVGMGISIYRSSDLAYFGNAINISGSQRMRTMLISNYSQDLYIANQEGDMDEVYFATTLLESEIAKYQIYMRALVDGNNNLDIAANKYTHIVDEIDSFNTLYVTYVETAEALLDDPSNGDHVEYIVGHSLELKNNIHVVVEMFEDQYDLEVQEQRNLDYTIIIISVIFTILGLFLTRRIMEHEKHATFDFLTGLKTRRVIFEEMQGKDSKNYTAMFVDLDKFKVINDTFGHLVGDEVLIAVSNRLREVFSPDSVYRYGGDEFLVLRETRSTSNVLEYSTEIGEHLKKVMHEPIRDTQGRYHQVSFSLGIVTHNTEIENFTELIDFSDDLMYDSKNYGSQIILCNSKEDYEFRKLLKEDVYHAFANKEFVPYFQSVRDRDDKIMGFESLARWNHKSKVIEPIKFIPLLHRTGLITDLDIFMINEVNRYYNEITCNKSLVTFSVNLSRDTILGIHNNELLETLRNISIPKQNLMLEISEEISLDENSINKLRLLSNEGFSLVFDDFTTGNTSIDSLRFEFVKRIKLDKNVMSSLTNSYQLSLIRELVYLMHSMDKKVLVEGVETEEQLTILRALYVDYFQGYYFDKPKKLEVQEICEIFQNEEKKEAK